jgi:release factor glutamine methyltransferase
MERSNSMVSIAESLKRGQAVLADSGVAESSRESVSLLAKALEKDKTFVYAYPEYQLSDADELKFDSLLRRRASREPFQYITGVQEFYGLEFDVTPDVLIPRPETEMVVEEALKILAATDAPLFCEVGIGSGCIAISILHQISSAKAIGLDISTTALNVARRNAEKLMVSDRLDLLESDVFGSLDNQVFDAIFSNPPYVPVRDLIGLQAEVRDFEPHVALSDGADGLSIMRRIVSEAPEFLNAHGSLLLEIGFDQSERVAAMFDRLAWAPPEILPDLQGIPRLVSARLK